jgi:hypothetical protein
MVAVRAQTLHQRITVDAGDRRLARRIDVGDDHSIGIVETGAELVEQSSQPREAMWLHDGDDPTFG